MWARLAIDIRQWPLVTYVDDVGTAIARGKEAAGDKNVLVQGAAVAQLALAAGLLDELERTRVLEGEAGVTHLRFRVRR